MVVVGWLGRGTTTLHCTHHALSHRLKVLSLFLLLSLPGPAVGEMLSATRYAAVGMVGRPLTHVVRDAFCEGSEGIAEVREQHRYPPTVSAVRERSGNVVGVHAVSLEIMQIVTSRIRTNYLGHCIGECCILASCNVVRPHQGPVSHS